MLHITDAAWNKHISHSSRSSFATESVSELNKSNDITTGVNVLTRFMLLSVRSVTEFCEDGAEPSTFINVREV
jgi:hypothetical protein